jgi:uncharacterized protein (DUF1697 family)
MAKHVALLRGINVGGHRKVPMAALRELAQEIGLGDPRTYVASGNMVFESGEKPAALERKLEQAIEAKFGFDVDVIVRTAAQWADHVASNPFPEESRRSPGLVMLVIGREAADDSAVERLRARASGGERVERRGGALWIWFANGAGRSKIGLAGGKGVWTSRNWSTVLALHEMLG